MSWGEVVMFVFYIIGFSVMVMVGMSIDRLSEKCYERAANREQPKSHNGPSVYVSPFGRGSK